MTRRTFGILLVLAFLAGIVLMVFFDETLTRVLGVGLLLGFVVGGVFLIADPVFVAHDAELDGRGRPRHPTAP
jgi:hypothetical protein